MAFILNSRSCAFGHPRSMKVFGCDFWTQNTRINIRVFCEICVFCVPYSVTKVLAIFGTVVHAPSARPRSMKMDEVSIGAFGVGVGIGVAVAIGNRFFRIAISNPDPDSDPDGFGFWLFSEQNPGRLSENLFNRDLLEVSSRKSKRKHLEFRISNKEFRTASPAF
jgi:hypothetical protein